VLCGDRILKNEIWRKTMTRKILLILALIVLGAVSAGFHFSLNAVQPRHCVTGVQSTSEEMNPPTSASSARCFDTPAEAVEFATGGEIRLDRSATSEEISRLLREYYDSLVSPAKE